MESTSREHHGTSTRIAVWARTARLEEMLSAELESTHWTGKWEATSRGSARTAPKPFLTSHQKGASQRHNLKSSPPFPRPSEASIQVSVPFTSTEFRRYLQQVRQSIHHHSSSKNHHLDSNSCVRTTTSPCNWLTQQPVCRTILPPNSACLDVSLVFAMRLCSPYCDHEHSRFRSYRERASACIFVLYIYTLYFGQRLPDASKPSCCSCSSNRLSFLTAPPRTHLCPTSFLDLSKSFCTLTLCLKRFSEF